MPNKNYSKKYQIMHVSGRFPVCLSPEGNQHLFVSMNTDLHEATKVKETYRRGCAE